MNKASLISALFIRLNSFMFYALRPKRYVS